MEGNYKNMFVRFPNATTVFEGKCWPGESVWIDYLNENAQAEWEGLFTKFYGTNYLYGIWNDMNEPSVFKGTEEIE